MKKIFVLIILISFRSYSQNLVPNPSFEAYDLCGTFTYCANLTMPPNKPCYSTCCLNGLPLTPSQIVSGTKNWWGIIRANDGLSNPGYLNLGNDILGCTKKAVKLA